MSSRRSGDGGSEDSILSPSSSPAGRRRRFKSVTLVETPNTPREEIDGTVRSGSGTSSSDEPEASDSSCDRRGPHIPSVGIIPEIPLCPAAFVRTLGRGLKVGKKKLESHFARLVGKGEKDTTTTTTEWDYDTPGEASDETEETIGEDNENETVQSSSGASSGSSTRSLDSISFPFQGKGPSLSLRVKFARLRFSHPLEREIDPSDYQFVKRVGSGGSGSTVFLAKQRETGQRVAIKVFSMFGLTQEHVDVICSEARFHSQVAHRHILGFHGLILRVPQIGLMMEFCPNSDVRQFLRRYQKKTESAYPVKEKMVWLEQIAMGMDALHSNGMIHRDLKCANVLLDAKLECKLCDFGLARQQVNMTKTGGVGTSIYMAPELMGMGRYDEKIDVYAFAILAYCLLTENFQPYGQSDTRIEIRVSADPTFRPPISALRSRDWLHDLITSCWSHHSDDRPSFREIRRELFSRSREDVHTSLRPLVQFVKLRSMRDEEAVDVIVRDSDVASLRESVCESLPNHGLHPDSLRLFSVFMDSNTGTSSGMEREEEIIEDGDLALLQDDGMLVIGPKPIQIQISLLLLDLDGETLMREEKENTWIEKRTVPSLEARVRELWKEETRLREIRMWLKVDENDEEEWLIDSVSVYRIEEGSCIVVKLGEGIECEEEEEELERPTISIPPLRMNLEHANVEEVEKQRAESFDVSVSTDSTLSGSEIGPFFEILNETVMRRDLEISSLKADVKELRSENGKLRSRVESLEDVVRGFQSQFDELHRFLSTVATSAAQSQEVGRDCEI